MSNELIKKAYEDFNGVWPYGDGDSMIISGKLNSTWGEGQYSQTDAESEKHFKHFHGHHLWKWVGAKADFDAYGESLKEEWTPKVDVKCLGKIFDQITMNLSYVEVIPLRKLGSEWVVLVGDDGRPSYCDEFRPLKTEDEKQAEEMWDIVKDATDTYHACELLVKNGFKKCAG
jgi:hypothetical protein